MENLDLDNLLGDSNTQTEVQTETLSVKTTVPSEEEYLINSDKEETELTLEYARAMISLEKDIKEIKDDMKALKEEYKDNGVSVQKVNKAIKNIKMAMKLNELDEAEIEMIQTVLSADPDIHTEIAQLVSKD